MSKYLYLTLLLLSGLLSCAYKNNTIISGRWCSNERKICMTLNESGYSSIEELDFIKYKYLSKKKILKIFFYYNPRIIFGRRLQYLYYVDKLNKDTLVISPVYKDEHFEHLGDTVITFTSKYER